MGGSEHLHLVVEPGCREAPLLAQLIRDLLDDGARSVEGVDIAGDAAFDALLVVLQRHGGPSAHHHVHSDASGVQAFGELGEECSDVVNS